MAPKSARTKVFISYSHKDKRWLEQLQVHLKPLEREGIIDRWDDSRIRTGQKWKEEIEKALAQAKVAILLVSPEFLASDFVIENELPPILEAQEKEGLSVFPVLLSPSLFIDTKSLSQFQAVNDPSKTLSELRPAARSRIWIKLARDIRSALAEPPLVPKENDSTPSTKDLDLSALAESHVDSTSSTKDTPPHAESARKPKPQTHQRESSEQPFEIQEPAEKATPHFVEPLQKDVNIFFLSKIQRFPP